MFCLYAKTDDQFGEVLKMTLFEIGRLCLKIAGRDAGQRCVIIDQLDANYVLVDGQTRRRRVNIKHLEALPELIEIARNASPSEIKKAFEKLGLAVTESKPKKTGPRVMKHKAVKAKTETKKEAKKPAKKKAEAKEE